MFKFTVFFFLVIASVFAYSSNDQLLVQNFESISLTFKINNESSAVNKQSSNQILHYIYKPTVIFKNNPSVCLAIKDFNVNTLQIRSLSISAKGQSYQKILIQILYEKSIWQAISISMIITTNRQLILGSFKAELNIPYNQKQTALLALIDFKYQIPHSRTAVAKLFLNGYNLSCKSNLQISIFMNVQTYKIQSNQLQIKIQAGPRLEVSYILLSYLIFDLNTQGFVPVLGVIQLSSFIGKKVHDIGKKIQDSKNNILGLQGFKFTSSITSNISFDCQITNNSTIALKSSTKLDQIILSYIIFKSKINEYNNASTPNHTNNVSLIQQKRKLCLSNLNTFWTGYSCACKVGYQKNLYTGICQVIAFNNDCSVRVALFDYQCNSSTVRQNNKIQCENYQFWDTNFNKCKCLKGLGKLYNYYLKKVECYLCPNGTYPSAQNQFCEPIHQNKNSNIPNIVQPLNNKDFRKPQNKKIQNNYKKQEKCELNQFKDKFGKCNFCSDFQNQIVANNECICKEGYYLKKPSDLKCTIKCKPNEFVYQNQCAVCPQNTHYSQSDQLCICNDGYQFNEQTNLCEKQRKKNNKNIKDSIQLKQEKVTGIRNSQKKQDNLDSASIELDGKVVANSINVFFIMKIYPKIELNSRQQQKNLLKIDFLDQKCKAMNAFCNQKQLNDIQSKQNITKMKCVLFYQSEVPKDKCLVNISFNKDGKKGAITFDVKTQ